MKTISLFSWLFVLTILNSCNKSNSDNSDYLHSNEPPVSPTNLIAVFVFPDHVQLSWTDNSDNETGFTLERRLGNAAYSTLKLLPANNTIFTDSGLAGSFPYSYKVIAFNQNGNSPAYSNEVTVIIPAVILTTSPSSALTATMVNSGGNITSDGGFPVTARGVVWSVSPHPTIALNTKSSDGVGRGNYTSRLFPLSANTVYYARAYGTNSNGTYYGNEINFLTAEPNLNDISGNSYPTVRIGSQLWIQQNLNSGRFRNGDPIPVVTDPVIWSTLTTPARCFYYNDSANYTHEWGSLYNWYAVNDPRGLAPVGWHIPSDNDWTALINYLGGPDSAGGRMKSTSSYYWWSPNTGATNSSGFTAIPAGLRDINGVFQSFGSDGGFWWSSTALITNLAWARYVVYDAAWCYKGNGSEKQSGLSIRCVKD